MAVFLQPIYTQTVGAGGAASVAFNNIPQTFTDLKIVISVRNTGTYAGGYNDFDFYINNSTANGSRTFLYGKGNGYGSARDPYLALSGLNNSVTTSNTFTSIDIYIPNYTSSNYKQLIIDTAEENNATDPAYSYLQAQLWSNTSAISSVKFQPNSTFNISQYSTFSLYGILRQGV